MTEPGRERETRRSGWLWIWIIIFVAAVLLVVLWAWPAREPPRQDPGEVGTVPVEAVVGEWVAGTTPDVASSRPTIYETRLPSRAASSAARLDRL